MSKKSSRGFTLIELIVVVAIIGIISAVGTVAYQGYTKGARESSVSSLIQQISLGQLEYYSNTGGYFISNGASTTTCNADEDSSAARTRGGDLHDADRVLLAGAHVPEILRLARATVLLHRQGVRAAIR